MLDRSWLIDRGFEGFVSVSGLNSGSLDCLPEAPGVYAVLREGNSQHPEFLARSVGGHFKGKDPTVSRNVLENSWVKNSHVIYIGKAGRTDGGPTIRRRVGQYLQFGEGKPIGHWGGRYIWQLADHLDLIFAWKATPGLEPREVEQGLIAEFEKQFGKLPFANLKR